ncbi:MAG: restriction endonuclease subunit S [Burkholderiales bacterium]|jgi:type I restriction enzyme S subunit
MEVREPSAKYLARPGFKPTGVGVVPEDWDVDALDTLGKHGRPAIKAGPFGSSLTKNTYVAEGYKVYGQEQVIRGDYQYGDYYITRSRFNQLKTCAVEPGDILLSLVGTAGRVLVIPSGAPAGIINPRLIRFSFDPGRVLPHYFKFLFETEAYQALLARSAQGGTMGVLNAGLLRPICIPIPPIAEQEAIAEALRDADALIESLEQLLVKKRQVKQGAMQELLTGKKRLPGFSGEWEVKSLGDLFNFSGGYSASRDQLSAEGYCYLHYGDIHTSNRSVVNVRSEYQDIPKLDVPLKKVSSTSLLGDGDVVFVDASEDDEGTSKHVVIINPDKTPFISGLHTIVAKSRTNELDHQYRRYCFQTTALKAQFRFFAVGTKVSGISKTNIVKVTLPVPTVPEQSAIAAILSDMDAGIVALEAKLAKARDLKQGMMQELLTGRIRLI